MKTEEYFIRLLDKGILDRFNSSHVVEIRHDKVIYEQYYINID